MIKYERSFDKNKQLICVLSNLTVSRKTVYKSSGNNDITVNYEI